MFSPVALFVYNRVENTRQTLRALMANTLATQTDLYVFSDGGKDEASWADVGEVRSLLHEVEQEIARSHSLLSMTIVERPVNFYLERNVIEGINQVLEHHDTIIVLEDDIVTSPHFLQFMNDALTMYRDEQRVMHIGGFTRLNPQSSILNPQSSILNPQSSLYFSPFMAGWGWGTWRDRWQQHFRHYQSRSEALEGLNAADMDELEYGGVFPCLKNLDRQPIPWDICWGIAIHRAHGLCLYPSHTLVRNIGLEGGTHYGHLPAWCTRLLQYYEYDRPVYESPVAVAKVEPKENPQIEAAMKTALTDWGIRYTWLGRVIRSAYKRLKIKD